MKAALLVVDMQNDFVAESAAIPVRGIREKLPAFSTFISSCRQLAVPLVYTRHCYDPAENPVEARLFPELKRGGLRKGTQGWAICDELSPQNEDLIIDKPRYDAFFNTNLLEELHARKIDTVIITGTMTEVCCESTARSAMYNDLRVLFSSDLTHCSDPSRHAHTLGVIGTHFGEVLSTEEILARLI